MPRQDNAQLNIRSAFARARVAELVAATGMTATQVVEEALRGYAPPVEPEAEARPPAPPGMVWRGKLLVHAARPGQKQVTLAETNRAIAAIRNRQR
jgi:hypothetical protein